MLRPKHLVFPFLSMAIFLAMILTPDSFRAESVVDYIEVQPVEYKAPKALDIKTVQKQKQHQSSQRKKRKLQKWFDRLLKNKKTRSRFLSILLGGGLVGFLFRRRIKRLQKRMARRPITHGDGNAGGCILAILLLSGCVSLLSWLGVDPVLGLALFVILALIWFVFFRPNRKAKV